MAEIEALLVKAELLEQVISYWDEVDSRWGETAHDRFIEDGTFESENSFLQGRDEIKSFYDWRKSRGDRVARHIVNNARVGLSGPDLGEVRYLMTIYAVDGVPVLPVHAPNLIADVTDTFIRRNGRWLLASKVFKTLFKGDIPATIMPKDVLNDLRAAQAAKQ